MEQQQALLLPVPYFLLTFTVKGYFMWALMDNFSWFSGYRKRYGFVFVERDTMQRYRKKSSYWFQQVAEKHGF